MLIFLFSLALFIIFKLSNSLVLTKDPVNKVHRPLIQQRELAEKKCCFLPFSSKYQVCLQENLIFGLFILNKGLKKNIRDEKL